MYFFYYFSESRRRRRKRKSPNFHSKYERLDARASLHRKRKEKSFPFFFLLLLFLLPFAISKKIRRIIVAYNLSKTKQMEKSSEETSEIKIKKKNQLAGEWTGCTERVLHLSSRWSREGKEDFLFCSWIVHTGLLGCGPVRRKNTSIYLSKKEFFLAIGEGCFFLFFLKSFALAFLSFIRIDTVGDIEIVSLPLMEPMADGERARERSLSTAAGLADGSSSLLWWLPLVVVLPLLLFHRFNMDIGAPVATTFFIATCCSSAWWWWWSCWWCGWSAQDE